MKPADRPCVKKFYSLPVCVKFQTHRAGWLGNHSGKFAVIQDSTVAPGFFATYADAVRAGLRVFGVKRPFLVKQVFTTDPVYVVS